MRVAFGLVAAFVCSAAFAVEPAQRTLTFEHRVDAQAAIERVYYGHQLGATKSFEEAVPRAVLEGKVRKYLEQSSALSVYWKTAVTDQTLQRELVRMAQGTRMPERLEELYAALGNDPFLVKECLARPALVDRLTHNFYAFDPTLHVTARAQIDELHRQLASGELSPKADHPNRTVSELVASETESGPLTGAPSLQRRVTPEEFQKHLIDLPSSAGQASDVKETRDAFAVRVLLSQTATAVRVASYVVPKTTWDAWWAAVHSTVRGDSVTAVASGLVDLPAPDEAHRAGALTACADDTWDNGILDDVPEPRSDHTAVWTGSTMIVWGGTEAGYYSPTGYVTPHPNTGWRYDPATDTWTPTSTVGAPSGRFKHTAVWTGRVMVVWGGNDGAFHNLNTGGRYDPATDSWTATSNSGAPAARSFMTAVWTGHLMVVWGGDSNLGSSNTGGRYDPTTDTWTSTSTVGAPQPRNGHTAVWTGNLMVVWGGNGTQPEDPNNTGPLNSGGRYDPDSDTWTAMSGIGAPAKRAYHAAVWTGHEVVIWGGFGYEPPVGYDMLISGGRYNPNTDTWTSTSTVGAPAGRYPVAAVWTGLTMVVWGGGTYDGQSRDTGGQYDPATDAWTPTSTVGAPSARNSHTAVWTGRVMVVWGGSYLGNTGGRYDPATDSWTPTSTAGSPDALYQSSAVWTGSVMVVWGGYFDSRYSSAGGRYDPVLDNWTSISTEGAPSARGGHTAVWTGSQLVVWGGWIHDYYHPEQYFDDGGRYDPVSDSWAATSTAGAPLARANHAAIWTGSRMVVWGGDGGYYAGYLVTGGRYDPATDSWTGTSVAGVPAARKYHTAIWTGKVMVVWGGQASTYPYTANTGGRYDPTTDSWTPTSMASAPVGRYWHSAVWTGSRMVVWGGHFDGYPPDASTGGQYDPVNDTWTPTSTAGAPSGRIRFTAIWTGSRMVVWGGTNDSQLLFDTGGRYDPVTNTWASTSIAGAPLARAWHTAVWTGREMVVWGGGHNTGGRYVVTVPSDDCDGDGFSASNGDCDDTRASVYPGAFQVCDGFNNDCSDPAWPAVAPNETNADGDAFPLCADDCDDTQAFVYPGAPEKCNGFDDDCDSLIDNGGDTLCDDANVCTDDSCHGADACVHVSNSRACDDANACTSGDFCSGGTCGGDPVNGIACDDGNACTTNDSCGEGTCNGGSPLECSDGDACNGLETCTPWTGCLAGTPPGCIDLNPCTDDSCDPAAGCVFINNTNPCTDGYACTVDACRDGWCQTTPIICDDSNLCTDDYCDPETGCVNRIDDTNACSDGSLCTQTDTCHAGSCSGSDPVQCNAGCPAGFTPEGGLCRKTYDIGVSLLDNQNARCDGTGRDRYNGCNSKSYGFHWKDLGASLATVTRVDVDFETGVNCGGSSSTVTLNGVPVGSFSRVASCQCSPVHGTISFSNLDAANYSMSGANAISIIPSGSCEGLSTSEILDNSFARVTVTYVPYSACQIGACVPATGACTFSDLPNGSECTDDDACTSGDICDGGACLGGAQNDCNDGNVCTDDACDPTTGCVHTNNTITCDDGNACSTGDTCGGGACNGGSDLVCDDNNLCTEDSCDQASGCVYTDTTASCTDNNPCTIDTCNPANGCIFTNNAIACDDGSACTTGDICGGGTCSGTTIACNDTNLCTTDTCNPATGCVFTNNSNSCNDANACTQLDVCANGACVGSNPVVCGALDQCHAPGVCDSASGACSNPTKPDGTACNDNDLCTTGETCELGSCTPAFSGLTEPNPRSNGWYKRLCHGPHSGDQLKDADAACVASVAPMFAGISNVADLCAELEPSQPNSDPCDRSDDDLMVLALNICRARVCTAQGIDSQCGSNDNVGQSLAESDAILRSASRNGTTCAHAKCLDEEINTGRALELNTLTLRREGSAVRLDWRPPYLDDGTAHPGKYRIWRRTQGSLAPFTVLGATTNATFLDTASGSGAFEYEVTAVMN